MAKKFNLKRVVCAAALATGALAAGTAFATTPVNQGVYTPIAYQPSDPRGDLSDLTWRANQMDDLIANNESAILTSSPDLGTQWMNRITISGILNVDAAISQRSYASTGATPVSLKAEGLSPNYGNAFNHGYESGLWLNDSEIDIDAQINCWIKAHVALMGGDDNSNVQEAQHSGLGFQSNTINPGERKLSTTDNWIDEAYITLGDFTQTPFYATVGREYVPFGHYVKNELTPAATTYLTETQATAADVGFVTPFYNASNVYGSFYILDGLHETNANYATNGGTSPNRLANFGADLGINKKDQTFGYSAGVSYLQNMADINTITNVITGFGMGSCNVSGGYATNIPALSGYAGANYGPFNAEVDGVSALRNFSTADLGYVENGTLMGALPAAINAKAGYNFSTLGHDSEVYFRYDHSWESVALALPQNQYLGAYNIDLAKNTSMEFQVMYNDDYSTSNGGTGKGSVEGAARLSVLF